MARDKNVKHKPYPILPEEQRRTMIAALKPVDHAILGDQTDMFRPIEEIRPDIITIGFNQYFDEKNSKASWRQDGFVQRSSVSGDTRTATLPARA